MLAGRKGTLESTGKANDSVGVKDYEDICKRRLFGLLGVVEGGYE